MTDPISRLNAALENRYSIERELGEGGMANVYLADDVKHDRKVAIKVLKPELAAIVGAERFLAEIKTTANLQHPHILPLHDSGEADGFLFYVMPYVAGESLRDKLEREKQLSVKESMAVTQKVAGALDYAHQRGVVHRDVKPANILLSEQGEPLVADFGIALAVAQAGAGRITETGLSLGTPHYMSPEQATGDRDIDPRSDVYALGCVLYEMLAGQPPFSAPSAQAVLVQVLTSAPTPITSVRQTVPPHVEAVLAKSLEKLPADRFESAAAFRTALEDEAFRYRSGPAGAASAPSGAAVTAGTPPPPGVRRYLHTGATVLLGLTALWLAFGPEDSEAPAVVPVVSFVLNDSTGPDESTGKAAPDGTIAYVADGELFVRPPGALVASQLSGTENDVIEGIVFSPDGAWLAYVTSRAGAPMLRKVPASGGSVSTLWTGDSGSGAVSLFWGEDGQLYLSVLTPGTGYRLSRVPEAGGAEETLLESESQILVGSAMLPGARSVVFTPISPAGADGGGVVLLDLASGDTSTVVADGFDARWSPTGHLIYAHESGALWALPFDPEGGTATGVASPILDGVSVVPPFAGGYDLSPGGTLVYISGGAVNLGFGGDYAFELVDIDGVRERLPIPPSDHQDAKLSPNGRSLAYVRETEIWTFDLDRGSTNTLYTGTAQPHNPVWSPDGTRIAFRADDGQIYARDAGGDEGPILLGGSAPGNNPSQWLEDGTLLYYTEGAASVDVFSVSGEGGGSPTALLDADWDERAPLVSPDGRWIAYSSNRNGTLHQFVRSWPDLLGETQVSEGAAPLASLGFPVWSADSRTLYYYQLPRLMAATFDTDGGFTVVDRTPVAPTIPLGNTYVMDIHPDGRFLIATAGPEASDAQVESFSRRIVVTNFFEHLKQRMGGG